MSIPLTQQGFDRMKEEVARLKKVDRPQNIIAISEARAHGDLSENAEYDAAKERQGFIEGRIKELESKMADAEIIDLSTLSCDRAVFGTTVHLINQETGEAHQYTLVGVEEADIKVGRISLISPLGRALVRHQVGDIVKVITPAKTVEYEIIKISVNL